MEQSDKYLDQYSDVVSANYIAQLIIKIVCSIKHGRTDDSIVKYDAVYDMDWQAEQSPVQLLT